MCQCYKIVTYKDTTSCYQQEQINPLLLLPLLSVMHDTHCILICKLWYVVPMYHVFGPHSLASLQLLISLCLICYAADHCLTYFQEWRVHSVLKLVSWLHGLHYACKSVLQVAIGIGLRYDYAHNSWHYSYRIFCDFTAKSMRKLVKIFFKAIYYMTTLLE